MAVIRPGPTVPVASPNYPPDGYELKATNTAAPNGTIGATSSTVETGQYSVEIGGSSAFGYRGIWYLQSIDFTRIKPFYTYCLECRVQATSIATSPANAEIYKLINFYEKDGTTPATALAMHGNSLDICAAVNTWETQHYYVQANDSAAALAKFGFGRRHATDGNIGTDFINFVATFDRVEFREIVPQFIMAGELSNEASTSGNRDVQFDGTGGSDVMFASAFTGGHWETSGGSYIITCRASGWYDLALQVGITDSVNTDFHIRPRIRRDDGGGYADVAVGAFSTPNNTQTTANPNGDGQTVSTSNRVYLNEGDLLKADVYCDPAMTLHDVAERLNFRGIRVA